MKRPFFARVRVSGLVLAALVVAMPALADAPIDPPQYEQFDRDTTEITDVFTKLVWDRKQVRKNVTFAQAESVCGTPGVIFAAGGRVPTVKELLTLVDEDPHQEYDTTFNPPFVLKTIDQLAFPDTPTDKAYWTSTVASPGKVFAVSFATGRTEEHAPTDALHVRCVR